MSMEFLGIFFTHEYIVCQQPHVSHECSKLFVLHDFVFMTCVVSFQITKPGNVELIYAPINVMPHIPPPEWDGDKGRDLTGNSDPHPWGV